ncbi:hypothetical protein [Kitasatospora purpeofusca]|uniref:VMAP-C domain-containing protein n=1 Tax=Kitasatospora purpeofusca TaxID=67352 RepID=UPI003648AAAA
MVVGIENYPDFPLDGPAADAVDFCAWLRERGVPAGNISLWLAPTETRRAAVTERARDLGLDPAELGRHDWSRLLGFLRSQGTHRWDLLYIYWAGHGVMAEGGRRLLLLPESTDDNPTCLDLTELLELTSDPTLWQAAHQIYLVDVCAVYAEAYRGGPKPTVYPLGAVRRDDVCQFAAYAAAPGQSAREALGRGLFSGALLQWLRLPGRDRVMPDLHILSEELGTLLAPRLSPAGQTPTYLWIQDWSRDQRLHTFRDTPAPDPEAVRAVVRALLHTLPDHDLAPCTRNLAAAFGRRSPGPDNAAAVLAALLIAEPRGLAALTELVGRAAPAEARRITALSWVLSQHLTPLVLSPREYSELGVALSALPAVTAQQIRSCAKRTQPAGLLSLWSAPAGDDGAVLLTAAIDHFDRLIALDAFPGGQDDLTGIPYLVWFVEHLRALVAEGTGADPRLKAWTQEATAVRGVSADALATLRIAATHWARETRPPARPTRVVVELEPYERLDRARSRYQCWVWVDTGDGELSLHSARPETPCSEQEAVQRILAAAREVSGSRSNAEQIVEVVVRPSESHLPIDDWRAELPGSPRPGILGAEHPVVLRFATSVDLTGDRTFRWSSGNTDLIVLRDEDAEADLAYLQLTKHHEAARAVVVSGPDRRSHLVRTAHERGYPVVIWARDAVAAVTRAAFDPLEPAGDLERLPARLREHRCLPGEVAFAVLWEPPDRPLPRQVRREAHAPRRHESESSQ